MEEIALTNFVIGFDIEFSVDSTLETRDLVRETQGINSPQCIDCRIFLSMVVKNSCC